MLVNVLIQELESKALTQAFVLKLLEYGNTHVLQAVMHSLIILSFILNILRKKEYKK